MNANELADELDKCMEDGSTDLVCVEQAATMLRQQKAEYYSLLVNHDKLYAKVVEQQAEIEMLKAKTLTDEEIKKVWQANLAVMGNDLDFARAILKKATNG